MNITFRQLQIFEAVAQHLSYTRASETLHLTQPAVSMQIKQLVEHSVGLPLFEQLGKKVFLGLGIVSLHTLTMELALKRLVVLDVVNFPIMRYWFIVHRSGKRLSLVAQAFQEFVREESTRILKIPAA